MNESVCPGQYQAVCPLRDQLNCPHGQAERTKQITEIIRSKKTDIKTPQVYRQLQAHMPHGTNQSPWVRTTGGGPPQGFSCLQTNATNSQDNPKGKHGKLPRLLRHPALRPAAQGRQANSNWKTISPRSSIVPEPSEQFSGLVGYSVELNYSGSFKASLLVCFVYSAFFLSSKNVFN